MSQALIGTRNGLYRLKTRNLNAIGLAGHDVTALHSFRGLDGVDRFLAGTYGDGMFRSDDDGETWISVEGDLTAPAIRTITRDPFDSHVVLCGTEPGRIFRSSDGGENWIGFDAIPNLPHSGEWFLPYSPRAGAVRNIYSPPRSHRLLASVEVGGLLESLDQGESWICGPILGDTDIHFVTGHPNDPDLLFAALGWASLKSIPTPPDSPPLGGIARSRDGGKTWVKSFTDYTRAVMVPPTMPEVVLAAPATRVGGPGRIVVSHDQGDSWIPAGEGIDMPMEDMIEIFIPAPDGSIWALRSGGGLLRAEPGEWHWTPVLAQGVEVSVRSIAFLQ